MPEHYRIICPECRAVLDDREAESPRKICPNCHKDITDSYEILYQPASRTNLSRKIVLLLLIAFAVIILLAVIAILFNFN